MQRQNFICLRREVCDCPDFADVQQIVIGRPVGRVEAGIYAVFSAGAIRNRVSIYPVDKAIDQRDIQPEKIKQSTELVSDLFLDFTVNDQVIDVQLAVQVEQAAFDKAQ